MRTISVSNNLYILQPQLHEPQKLSEYDQEIPQSQTADKPMVLQGKATQQS